MKSMQSGLKNKAANKIELQSEPMFLGKVGSGVSSLARPHHQAKLQGFSGTVDREPQPRTLLSLKQSSHRDRHLQQYF